ncbi:hypothetical protein IJ674_05055 [bacterium]|nr:hypothetical protein [bacterium]
MEIELGPFPKYENVRSNAYWSRVHIDTSLRIDDSDIEEYKAHLKDCNENPTIGLLAKRKYITKKPMNYPEYAHRNMRDLESQSVISELKKDLKSRIDKLYPNTKRIRDYIINNDRVTLDIVEKHKKYTTFNKLMVMLKKII